MKEKHIAGRISAALVIIVGLLSFPYAWFHIKVDEFIEHEFDINGNIEIRISAYQKATEKELTTQRDKNVIISALKREVEYRGPLFYRLPFQMKGQHEIYEVWIRDYTNGGHWILYIGDNEEYSYLLCGDDFNAGLEVNEDLMDILDEYTENGEPVYKE